LLVVIVIRRRLDPAVANGSRTIVETQVDGRLLVMECDLAAPNAWESPECRMERLMPSGPVTLALGEVMAGAVRASASVTDCSAWCARIRACCHHSLVFTGPKNISLLVIMTRFTNVSEILENGLSYESFAWRVEPVDNATESYSDWRGALVVGSNMDTLVDDYWGCTAENTGYGFTFPCQQPGSTTAP
jgi:hypothetical protein